MGPRKKTSFSPKGANVRDRKATFEKMQEKYRSQRNSKDTREKPKFKRERKGKPSPETLDNPVGRLLREIHANMKDVKLDLKQTNSKLYGLQNKIDSLESENKTRDEINLRKFEAINEDIAKIEDSVTTKIVSQFEPAIQAMKTDIQSQFQSEIGNLKKDVKEGMHEDIRILIREELAIQRREVASEDETEVREESLAQQVLGEQKKKKSKKKTIKI